jgi:short-subunit dehydrogenase/acyl carrier protein
VYIEDTLRNIRNAIVKYTGSFPEYLLILNELEFPRTTIGKIRKEELKKGFLGNQYIKQMEQYDKLFKPKKFIPDWFYESIWYRKKLANISKKSIGKVLVFLEASERNTTLVCYLASYFDCLFVICGNEYRECDDSFIIDIHRPGDFVNIFHKLTQEGQINQVIYFNSKVFNVNDELVDKSVQLHIETLIYLYRAICQFLKHDVCFIYLNIIQAWRVIDYVYDGISASAIALLKSFQAENNKFHFKFISVERLLDKIAIDVILKELHSPISESEVLLYKNDRYVRGLKSLSVEYPIKESFFKPNGFYIITGGFGAIGYEIAKLLVDKFSIDILLLGRRNFGEVPDANEKLAYLQRENNKVFYENADVCNQELLQDLVDRYSKLFDKPLSIIFHTAGVFKLHTLDSLTQQDIYQYTNSKIIGTINLLKVCQQYSKARLINFSSVNGFFGGANAALYAAANAFQDAMAHYQKKSNVVTLSWSMWKKFGMSSYVNFEELTKSRGFEVLDIEQGLGSFLLALHTNKPNILIGLNGNNRFINQYNNYSVINLEAVVSKTSYKSSSFKINDGFGHKVLVKNELLTQNSKLNGKLPKKQDNIAKLREIWKKLLELDDVDLEDNFFDLGGHSLLIPPLQAELKTQLNLDVKAVDLFKYPTITYFADQFFKNNALNDSDNVSSLVSHIWKEKLELDDIGYQDNFFELGAHSLMIPAVQAALNKYFDIKLNIVDIFKHPNVNSLSQYISQLLVSKGSFSASLHEDIEKLRDRKKGFLGLQKKLIDEKII